MSETQAIPKNLNLTATKPTSVPAYTRRVTSIATNAQTFTDNTLANIILDTSTPGSFLDPNQSLINFDLVITNTNPYVDYINFSTCGAGSLIQEMRIICQGTPIEEILDYNTMFEMWMDIGGLCQEEFKMYMENPWRAPAIHPSTEVNFVKPPMVDREGVIMCPNNLNMFGVPSKFHNYRTQGRYRCLQNHLDQNVGLDSSVGVNNGRQIVYTSTDSIFNLAYNEYGNYIHNWNPDDAFWTGSAAPGNIRASTWTNCIDNTYVTWPSTIRPVPKSIMEEKLKLMDGDIKKYRLQDYLMFLANVKNVPIGVTGAKSMIKSESAISSETPSHSGGDRYSTNWNWDNQTSHSTNLSSTTKLNISLPIFSGILGVWAEKAFPTMLVAPGSFYIQLRFAKMAQAFQLAMDPCRRVIGTYRDYVPSYGLVRGYQTEVAGTLINNTKTDYETTNTGIDDWIALTDNAANGTDFAWKGITIHQSQTGYTFGGTKFYMENPMFDAFEVSRIQSTAGGKDAPLGVGEGYTTGTPKPQYVPTKTPWVFGGHWKHYIPEANVYCCEESECCFGTYLPASTAQVRRTTQTSNDKIPDAAKPYLGTYSQPKMSISIENLCYVGQQIILPDEVTASIVRMAVNGDISIVAHSCRTYRQLLQASTSQNIILPIKIASANALFILFQNSTMIENTHYLSCTRICPFTSLQWTNDTNYFVGSDTAPNLSGISTYQPFSIQLRIGNEYLPIQPITNIPMVVQELQRAVHAVQDMTYSVPTVSSVRHIRGTDNTKTTNTLTNNGEFLSLTNNDFTCPFVPIEALDDQTITDNINFREHLTSSSGAFVQANSRGNYVLNHFLPPVSKFMLGFDLETFPNQSDVARSGRYLGNGPLTLSMTNVAAANNPSIYGANQDTIYAIAVVLFDIRFSIMTGGQILAYY